MWGRLNPHLGWQWRDSGGEMQHYYLSDMRANAGMLTGKAMHSGITATRPIQDFDQLSLDGIVWLSVSELLALVPREDTNVLRRTVVPVQVRQDLDAEEVL